MNRETEKQRSRETEKQRNNDFQKSFFCSSVLSFFCARQRREGHILIEALVAMSIITVSLLGVFELLSRSLSLNRVVGDQYIASNLATEGIEVVKNMLDTNILQGGQAWNTGMSEGVYEVDYVSTSLTERPSLSSNPSDCTASYVRQNANPLTFDGDAQVYGYDFALETPYKRAVCIEYLDETGNQLRVNSVVAWTSRGGMEFDVNLEDVFSCWHPNAQCAN